MTNDQQASLNNNIRVRFAPSPTGNLHIGSARTALFNWLFARNNSATFILRIEDTDTQRSTKEFENTIIDDLKWLGIDYDEGPDGGDFGPYYQSQRFGLYKEKARQLVEQGDAYYCFCTPEDLQVEKKKAFVDGKPPRYSGRCRELDKNEIQKLREEKNEPSIRFRVKSENIVVNDLIYSDVKFDSSELSDFIILRPDGSATFHLAVIVDDGEMKITHVIRGEDHLSNTPKHILLFNALGYELPKFAHIPIILGTDKSKLSKRHGATSIDEYRAGGFLPQAIVNALAMLSWSPPEGKEVLSVDELIDLFDLEKVSKSPAIFDIDKLKWLNGQHIRLLSPMELAKHIKPYLETRQMIFSEDKLVRIAEAIKEDLVTLDEAPDYASLFIKDNIKLDDDAVSYLQEDFAKQAIVEFKNGFEKNNPQTTEEAKELLKEHSANLKPHGIKGKNAFMPIRLALTGDYSGPELFFLISLLGKDNILNRLDYALNLKSQ